MAELRWALIAIAVLFVAGLALWEWRRARRSAGPSTAELAMPSAAAQGAGESWSRRVEPRLDSLLEDAGEPLVEDLDAGLGELPVQGPGERAVPVIHPAVEISVPVARESAVDRPVAAGTTPRPMLIRWPPVRADRVLSLRLANAQGAPLAGREVRLALEQAGLVAGPQTIYHRVDAQGAVLVSAANMLRPGDLDPQRIDEQQLRGLSLFSVLPGPLPPVRMLEELVATARSVALRLQAVVQDERGTELSSERLVQIRRSLPDADEGGAS